MKLKTLKKMRKGNLGVEFILMEDKIRAEAIKDYNNFKEKIFNCCGEIKDESPLCEQCSERYAVMVYIKWKNNITEEDLK